jgi:hypothetical protein
MLQESIIGVLGLVLLGISFLSLSPESLQWTLATMGLAIVMFSVWDVITRSESEKGK